MSKNRPQTSREPATKFAQPFPDADFELEWLRPDGDGNVYQGRFEIEGQIQEMEGWLCPALNLYYQQAPKKLYVQVRDAK